MKAFQTFRALLVLATLTTAGRGAPCNAADARAPYDVERFRPVLDDSKLQAPTSSPALIEHGDFAGKSNDYFFLDATGTRLTFTVTGDSKRSELRQLSGDWDTATPTPQRLVARVKVFVPETPSLEQFTFMQIHDKKNGDDGLNKPLIRLTWRKSRSKVRDHLWAGLRIPQHTGQPISLENLASEWVDLGPRPDGFFDAEIRVQNGQMSVVLDGETKLEKDVNYWNGLENYFKAGVYNQDPGTSKVEFEVLRYATSDDDETDHPASTAPTDTVEPALVGEPE